MCQISYFERKMYYKYLKPLRNWVAFYFCDFVFCKTLTDQVAFDIAAVHLEKANKL